MSTSIKFAHQPQARIPETNRSSSDSLLLSDPATLEVWTTWICAGLGRLYLWVMFRINDSHGRGEKKKRKKTEKETLRKEKGVGGHWLSRGERKWPSGSEKTGLHKKPSWTFWTRLFGVTERLFSRFLFIVFRCDFGLRVPFRLAL